MHRPKTPATAGPAPSTCLHGTPRRRARAIPAMAPTRRRSRAIHRCSAPTMCAIHVRLRVGRALLPERVAGSPGWPTRRSEAAGEGAGIIPAPRLAELIGTPPGSFAACRASPGRSNGVSPKRPLELLLRHAFEEVGPGSAQLSRLGWNSGCVGRLGETLIPGADVVADVAAEGIALKAARPARRGWGPSARS